LLPPFFPAAPVFPPLPCRLQTRLARKLEQLSAFFQVAENVPTTVSVDVERIQAALLNLESAHNENLIKAVFPQLVIPEGIIEKIMELSKIKASGADSVVTGNWGQDLTLLIKAANEGGYNGKFFTYYTGVTGTPTALGKNGEGRVYQVAYNHYNMGGQMDKWMNEFKTKYNDDFYTGSVIRIYEVLGAAMAKAKSTDPVKVAAAMEGIKVKSFNGEVEMRRVDHQLQQPLYMTVWQKAGGKFPYSPENTGMTLVPVKEYPNYVSSTPTSCQMKRP
jgi:hypothetical protein